MKKSIWTAIAAGLLIGECSPSPKSYPDDFNLVLEKFRRASTKLLLCLSGRNQTAAEGEDDL